MKKLHINTYRNLSLKIKISILSIFSVIALSVFVFNTSENKNNSSLFLKADVVTTPTPTPTATSNLSCYLDGITIPHNGQQTFYVNTSPLKSPFVHVLSSAFVELSQSAEDVLT